MLNLAIISKSLNNTQVFGLPSNGVLILGRDYKKATLEELLTGYKLAEMAAFEEFYRRTHQLIYSFVLRRLSRREDADDVVQEVYFRVHKYVTTYRPDQKAIVWLYAVARHAVIDRLTARQNREIPSENQETQLVSSAESAESRLIFNELLTTLLAGLSPAEQRLFSDRFISELDYDELALSHGITAVNARQKISRLLRVLKPKMRTDHS